MDFLILGLGDLDDKFKIFSHKAEIASMTNFKLDIMVYGSVASWCTMNWLQVHPEN